MQDRFHSTEGLAGTIVKPGAVAASTSRRHSFGY